MNGTGDYASNMGDVRIGRIVDEYLDRLAAGEVEFEEELLARHPDGADDIREHLRLVRQLRGGGNDLAEMIRDGVLSACDESGFSGRLGPYLVAGVIGSGGMGFVLKAYEPKLRRWVALKLLSPDRARERNAPERLAREARSLAALNHPHIIDVYAVEEHRDRLFIVMEYVDGCTLADVIRQRGPLPGETVRRILGQVIKALGAAHDAGLIHRDVKPSNILVQCGNGSADCGMVEGRAAKSRDEVDAAASVIRYPERAITKLADFGLARMRDATTQLTVEGSTPGTPEYMSPEQARGDRDIDQRSDLYSAGVVLYEMLTGVSPFRGATSSATVYRILHEAPEAPSSVFSEADRLLSKLALWLMSNDPVDRPKSALEVVAALEGRKPIPGLLGRRNRLRRFRLAKLAMLIVAAVGAVFAGVWMNGRSNAGAAVVPEERKGAAASPAAQLNERPRHIWSVGVDDGDQLTVLANYDDDATLRPFARIPEKAVRAGYENDDGLALIELEGPPWQVVIAGLKVAVDGHCAMAWDARGNRLWELELGKSHSWPDIKETTRWDFTSMTADQVLGDPEPELVIAANASELYPSRVCVIDSRTGDILRSFWHFGPVDGLQVARNLLPTNRPAILGTFINNKLDGFYDWDSRDPPIWTHWDTVRGAFILDPENMDGVGPPHVPHRLASLQPVTPWAYAFLNRPDNADDLDMRYSREQGVKANADEVAMILPSLELVPCHRDNSTGTCIKLKIRGLAPNGVNFTVDSNLDQPIAANATQPLQGLPELLADWTPVIQHGKNVVRPAHAIGGSDAQP